MNHYPRLLRTLVLTVASVSICCAAVVHAQTAPNRSMAWLSAIAQTWFVGGITTTPGPIPQCNLDIYVSLSSINLQALQTQVLATAAPCIPLVNNIVQQDYAAITNPASNPIVAQQTAQIGPWQVSLTTLPNGVVDEFDEMSGGLAYIIYDPYDETEYLGEVGALIDAWTCPVGMIAVPPIDNCIPASFTASIVATPTPPKIPADSSVQNGHVLTRDGLTVSVTQGGSPAPGISITLQSNRPQSDNITQPSNPTDQNGQTAGLVDTHDNDNHAVSMITVSNSNISTVTPASITWLPARYEGQFVVTCYAISQESNFLNTPMVTVPGIQGKKFHQGFLKDTEMNGTGETLDGSYIHYQGSGRFKTLPTQCAPTFTGTCAVDGVTVAVDPTVIPLYGEISIDTIGNRTAQDTGKGRIHGYHIDVFWGTRENECRYSWGTRSGFGVTFLNYGSES